ncbi:L-lysine 6-monooxygenase [Rathayibacter rathayi]|uniref:lysine N(6)-hydroxylase/L-ornithine N(5)-oxygenase family protein n=1 Tax=Rathayibacter rathayi TaxID=33887 RepID=UPI000BD67BA6|nr:SidA/IucD/PvdA family monooxygenase [Rathayibacter rathayi]AZZ48540.1 L-lysine 6-monooxygenase [Rathayibacter rathayi]MWV74851.1 SidA/IucD/PvdA family monooxygenase [Rathayibacter rathayi NCPPB 2980 = VKM Ac-1601]PPF80532.1 L-lysine 6-monooxygenase [Rathayibacter rathayi]PPG14190.1 L-lysine 6-monooxygenase [Rathayibacter rathayi]PPG44216.1 L-lysine 6-monooxygenase [Rathayibacter rathayi]
MTDAPVTAENPLTSGTRDDIVDVVGIGFGPSNLALAIALHERTTIPGNTPITARFVEAKPAFAWHPDMLLPGATMQVSFLKDLVTQRNPVSEYSFLRFLHESGRLPHFINRQTFFPTRIEFHQYLTWAADRVAADVRYGMRATRILDHSDHFEVALDGAHAGSVRARTVVLAGGLSARLPEGVRTSTRQFHNHSLLSSLAALPAPSRHCFVVVGAGQSAAEVTHYLHEHYPDARVHAVFGKYGYTPADDSPYANRIFDADAVDAYYASSTEMKARLLSYHRGTNYSAVDLPLIERLYDIEYAERVAGARRLFVHGASALTETREGPDGVMARIENGLNGTVQQIDADAVVYATGFTSMPLGEILGDLYSPPKAAHGVRVSRDYRLRTTRPTIGGVYLQGGTEDTHGLTSSLLSTIAVRSSEIAESIAAGLGARERELVRGA